MKKVFLLVVILSLSTTIYPQKTVLNNSSLIEMKKAGLSDALINAKISAESCDFDTSTDAILELKKHDFSDETIELMILKNQEVQSIEISDFIFPTSIIEENGKIVVNQKYTIEKGGDLQVYLPFAGKDFISITTKTKSNAKLFGKIAGAVSSGAAAVGVGSGNLGVMDGALKVMRGAEAVSWGADAIEKIEDLPISQNAKKIAGKNLKVISWKNTNEGYVITTELNKTKYEVNLSDAIMTNEIKLSNPR